MDQLETRVQKRLPFVWELEKDGVTSYAIGTMHAAPNWFDNELQQYSERAKHLLLECNPLKSPDVYTPEEVCLFIRVAHMPGFLRPPHERFTYLIFRNERHRFRGMEERLIEFHPENIVSLETETEHLRAAKIYGVTGSLKRLAEMELEQKGFIKQHINHVKAELLYEMNLYANSGHVKTLRSEFEETSAMKKNVTQRNRRMVQRSIPFLSVPSLIAVGYMHLMEEPSMLTMYQERGIRVERVQ